MEQLTDVAYRILLSKLIQYGNNPCKLQRVALYILLEHYSQIAQGTITGKHAFPLSTGLGKTQSVVAWLTALNQLSLIDDISVAVCASKVEALCDLWRDLVASGVPEEKIGLFHSYKYSPRYEGQKPPEGYASIPATSASEHCKKPILLTTHNRVRGKGGVDEYNLYQGKPRNLLIWDESLFCSDPKAMSERDIRADLLWAGAKYTNPNTLKALEYIKRCHDLIQTELELQKSGQKEISVVNLPPLSDREIMEYKSYLGSDTRIDSLRRFLDISQHALRVTTTDQNDGIISYEIAVPSELKNIVILDASHMIRKLVHLDKTIKDAINGAITDNLISYRNVTIHQLRHTSGRHTMTASFREKKRGNRAISNEICEVVKGIPSNEGIIIFTFLPRYKDVDFKKVLLSDLEAAGIGTEAKVSVQERNEAGETVLVEKDRFVWLTWGNETSLSQYSYCSNVVFSGVLHRNHLDLMSAIVGQKDDLHSDVTKKLIKEIEQSEICHCLYQAMSRGSCRIVNENETLPMNVWLIHKDLGIRELLGPVMPGARWETWEPKFLVNGTKVDQIAKQIQAILDAQPATTMRIATRHIKKELRDKFGDIAARTFTMAVDNLHTNEWFKEGRSLVRVLSLFDAA